STEDAVTQPVDVAPGQEREFVPIAKGVSTTVHLISDGRFPRLSDASLNQFAAKQTGSTSILGNLNVRYHRHGLKGPQTVNNVGIVAMNPIRYAGAKERANLDVQKLEIFVVVRNYRPKEATVKLKLDVYASGKLEHADQTTIELPKRVIKTN